MAIALVAPPLDASDGEMVTLDVVPVDASAYVLWDLEAPRETTLRVDVFGKPTTAHSLGLSFWLRGDRGTVHQENWLVSVNSVGIDIRSSAPTPARLALRAPPCPGEMLAPDGCSFGLWVSSPLPPGVWRLVVLGGVDGAWTGSVVLSADGDMGLRRQVGEAMFYKDGDFPAAVGVVAESPEGSLKLVQHGKLEVPVSRSLFASFIGSASALGDLQMAYDGPSGTQEGGHRYVIGGGGPGTYTFRVDRNVEPGLTHAPVWLVCADVADA